MSSIKEQKEVAKAEEQQADEQQEEQQAEEEQEQDEEEHEKKERKGQDQHQNRVVLPSMRVSVPMMPRKPGIGSLISDINRVRRERDGFHTMRFIDNKKFSDEDYACGYVLIKSKELDDVEYFYRRVVLIVKAVASEYAVDQQRDRRARYNNEGPDYQREFGARQRPSNLQTIREVREPRDQRDQRPRYKRDQDRDQRPRQQQQRDQQPDQDREERLQKLKDQQDQEKKQKVKLQLPRKPTTAAAVASTSTTAAAPAVASTSTSTTSTSTPENWDQQ